MHTFRSELDKSLMIDTHKPGGCLTNVSRALQNNLAKIYDARNYI